MRENLKSVGTVILAVCACIAFSVLVVMFAKGGVWLSERVLPWLAVIGALAFFLTVLVFLPLALFRRARPYAGLAIFYTSYIFGLNLWVFSLLLSYTLWGIGAAAVGLFLMGFGVVPIAVLATLFNGLWSALGELVLLTAMTIGCRYAGLWLIGMFSPEQSSPESVSAAAGQGS